HSGCGKTTIVMGINRALKRRDIDVQPWKAGPDYIDPGFHTIAAGRICRNLDTMILTDKVVREIYSRQSNDLSLIEGVMGLFDGAGALDERGSAAHLSKILKLPVILIIDGKAMARSGGAIALGFAEFDPEVTISGFILNNMGSERHYNILKESIEDRTGIPVLGYLPKDSKIELPERHLGLVPNWEDDDFEARLESLADLVETHIDLDKLIVISAGAGKLEPETDLIFSDLVEKRDKVTIGVAKDEAFHFYYEENLDLFRHYGAEIVYFSPLADKKLPDNVSAVYIGGG
ncbi:MAG: cobyrinate a,c-diamide synthase, partial [Proteobacteria bacterium]|nr:cobyrinate a,c-diamide synthase [Pseudomonadota bacterium]